MRENKYRAYDKETNTMIYSDRHNKKDYQVEYDFTFNESGQVVCWWNEDYDDSFGYSKSNSGYLDNVMQYVGFRDNKRNNEFPNGQEIYEGDIDSFGHVVTYLADLNGGLGMEAGWYLQRDNFESWSKLECDEWIEIIGNIFETPEKAMNNCNTDYTKLL